MINISELRDMPEARRLFKLFGAVLLVWITALLLLVYSYGFGGTAAADLYSSDRILDIAVKYKSNPDSSQALSAQSEGDPLSLVSDIAETLNMRDRVQQLQSNESGVLLQLERIYGDEMVKFLTTLESRGLNVKTAEIKALPSGDDRLLGATFLLEKKR